MGGKRRPLPISPAPERIELWAVVERDGTALVMHPNREPMEAHQRTVGGRLAHLVEVQPEDQKDEAMPPPRAIPTKEEREQVAKFERQKIAEAAAFLTNAGEVSNEMAGGIIAISENARALLKGPLTEEALLVLIQAKAGNARNGHPYGFEVIRTILTAASTLDEYLSKR